MTQEKTKLYRPEFPLTSKYDPEWIMDNNMGPNVLWLMEWLCRSLNLRPGMRVLDLGSGRAISSIFLAKEFDVKVWAADLWVDPDANWKLVREAGMEDLVYPIRMEAHSLPFPGEFFDVIVSADAYQYFGTDIMYLKYLSRFLKSGGNIGIVVPGLMQPIDEVPEHLMKNQSNGQAFWEEDCLCFQTKTDWKKRWEGSNKVDNISAEVMEDGWKYWRDFETELELAGKNRFPSVAEALDEDKGRYIGFVKISGARKDSVDTTNLYDPALIANMGIKWDE